MNRISIVLVSLALLSISAAQRKQRPTPKGMIFGTVIEQDGQPAKHVALVADPLGMALAAMLPHTRTDDQGKYRFENMPWWGRYTVYAQDEEAGYSSDSTGPAGHRNVAEVKITPQHPIAEFTVHLPPRAGFLHIHLTDQKTGVMISGMQIEVMTAARPLSLLFSESCSSTRTILLPPGKNLLVHVTSDGFREWNESIGRGKPLNLPSGTQLVLDVQLEPSE